MSYSRSSLRTTLTLVGSLIGCGSGAGLPMTHETEHLRIGTDQDTTLCAGDLIAFEQTIGRVEDELGVSMPNDVAVSIWSSEAWKAVRSDYCEDDPVVLGCMSYTENAIFTSLPSVSHELVHATIPVDDLTPFFAEGLAEVYGGAQSRFGATAPADSLALSGRDIDRPTATHFVRWLRETWGGAKLGRLARSGKRADEHFAEVYGMSFLDAQAMYFADAPFGYASIDACGAAPLDLADDLGGWRATVAFDCEHGEEVRGYGDGMMVARTFAIPVAGRYSVITDADWITLTRCPTGPIVDPIRLDEFDGQDVPPSYAGWLSEERAWVEGGSIVDLHFEAGEHEVELLVFGYDPMVVNVALWPSLGAGPVPTEAGN